MILNKMKQNREQANKLREKKMNKIERMNVQKGTEQKREEEEE